MMRDIRIVQAAPPQEEMMWSEGGRSPHPHAPEGIDLMSSPSSSSSSFRGQTAFSATKRDRSRAKQRAHNAEEGSKMEAESTQTGSTRGDDEESAYLSKTDLERMAKMHHADGDAVEEADEDALLSMTDVERLAKMDEMDGGVHTVGGVEDDITALPSKTHASAFGRFFNSLAFWRDDDDDGDIIDPATDPDDPLNLLPHPKGIPLTGPEVWGGTSDFKMREQYPIGCCPHENRQRFWILDEDNPIPKPLYVKQEDGHSWMCGCLARKIYGNTRQFKYAVRQWNFDMHDSPVVLQMRHNSYWPCMPCREFRGRGCRPQLDVGDGRGRYLGKVVDPCTLMEQKQEIYDEDGNHIFTTEGDCMTIYGKTCMIPFCGFLPGFPYVKDWLRFPIRSHVGGEDGSIRIKPGWFLRDNQLEVDMPTAADSPEARTMILASTLLTHNIWFEFWVR